MPGAAPPLTTVKSRRRDSGSRSGPAGSSQPLPAPRPSNSTISMSRAQRIVLQAVVQHQHVDLGMRGQQRAAGGGALAARPPPGSRQARDQQRLVADLVRAGVGADQRAARPGWRRSRAKSRPDGSRPRAGAAPARWSAASCRCRRRRCCRPRSPAPAAVPRAAGRRGTAGGAARPAGRNSSETGSSSAGGGPRRRQMRWKAACRPEGDDATGQAPAALTSRRRICAAKVSLRSPAMRAASMHVDHRLVRRQRSALMITHRVLLVAGRRRPTRRGLQVLGQAGHVAVGDLHIVDRVVALGIDRAR